MAQNKNNNDIIKHPEHYTNKEIECWDWIRLGLTKEEYIGGLKFALLKYIYRGDSKEDIIIGYKKARQFIDKIISTIEENREKLKNDLRFIKRELINSLSTKEEKEEKNANNNNDEKIGGTWVPNPDGDNSKDDEEFGIYAPDGSIRKTISKPMESYINIRKNNRKNKKKRRKSYATALSLGIELDILSSTYTNLTSRITQKEYD